MGSKKSNSETQSHSTTKTDMNQYQTTHQERFTDPAKAAAAWGLVGKAENAYNQSNDLATQLLRDYQSGKTLGDDSYFKQGWNKWNNIDTTNLQKINSGSYNPNDNIDWVSAMNDIDANARRQWGNTLNQVNQNIIASGMANGSGHQSAAYNAASGLNSQLAADRATRWQNQYNQNIANMMNANQQLNNIASGITSAGLNAWNTSQQGFNSMLQGINLRDNALKSLGNAIEMNADPTQTTQGRQWGTSTTDANSSTTSKQSSGFGDIIGAAAGMFTPIKWF